MDDQQTTTESKSVKRLAITEGGSGESRFLSVSIRGIITLTVVYTVCGMSIFQVPVSQELWFLAGTVVGWYFGQKEKSNEETTKSSTSTESSKETSQTGNP